MVIDIFPQEDADPIDIFDRNCVLIMDQDRENLDRLANQFGKHQFEVLAYTSGNFGVKAAKRVFPDCLIINEELVDVDGFTVCQTLVDDSDTCGIPVIMIGKNGNEAAVGQSKRSGAEFFLSQPLDPKSLIFLVNESIAQARSWICE